jgi:hypothetical protein
MKTTQTLLLLCLAVAAGIGIDRFLIPAPRLSPQVRFQLVSHPTRGLFRMNVWTGAVDYLEPDGSVKPQAEGVITPQ